MGNRASRAARVNAAVLREFSETADAVVQCGNAPAVNVMVVRAARNPLEGDPAEGAHEQIWLDDLLLPLAPSQGDIVTLNETRYRVAAPPSKMDPHGLTKLTLRRL